MKSLCILLATTIFSFASMAEASPVQLEIYFNSAMNKGLTGFPGSWCAVADRPGLIMEGKAHVQIIPVGREAFDTLKGLDPSAKYQCEVEGTVGPGDEFIPFYAAHISCR